MGPAEGMSWRMKTTQATSGLLQLLMVVVCLLIATPQLEGKVRRRLTIKSDPPGALVYVDDQRIGITPVSTSFTFYGTRKIQLIKDGYETITVMRAIRPPWYQITPLDFFTENLVTTEFRDERLLQFKLLPQRIRTDQELRQRGNQLRRRATERIVVPPPPAADPASRQPPENRSLPAIRPAPSAAGP